MLPPWQTLGVKVTCVKNLVWFPVVKIGDALRYFSPYLIYHVFYQVTKSQPIPEVNYENHILICCILGVYHRTYYYISLILRHVFFPHINISETGMYFTVDGVSPFNLCHFFSCWYQKIAYLTTDGTLDWMKYYRVFFICHPFIYYKTHLFFSLLVSYTRMDTPWGKGFLSASFFLSLHP